MGPEALAHVMRPLREIFDERDFPDLLVGLDGADDASVYRVAEDLAMIQSVDFFPPVVDDPYTYGSIAAANSMSDIYAMGGRVVLALNLAAFPADLPPEFLAEVIRGAAEKVREAGAVVTGGHTVTDEVPKFGLSVTGLVHPGRIWTKGGARPGDVLVLTKALGTGIIISAQKRGEAAPQHLAAASDQMARLNRWAAEALQAFDGAVHAATDITGFSLMGHAYEMAAASHARLRFELARTPFLDGACDYAERGFYCSGTARNEAYFGPHVQVSPHLDGRITRLLFGSETSGGLLVAVDPEALADLELAFHRLGQDHWIIGDVVPGEGIAVR